MSTLQVEMQTVQEMSTEGNWGHYGSLRAQKVYSLSELVIQKIFQCIMIGNGGHLNSGEISPPDQVVPCRPGQPMSLSLKPCSVLLPPCPHSPPPCLPNSFTNQHHALQQAADIGPDHCSGQASPEITCHLPQFTGCLQGTLPQPHASQPAGSVQSPPAVASPHLIPLHRHQSTNQSRGGALAADGL